MPEPDRLRPGRAVNGGLLSWLHVVRSALVSSNGAGSPRSPFSMHGSLRSTVNSEHVASASTKLKLVPKCLGSHVIVICIAL